MRRKRVTIRLPEFLIGPPGVIEQNFDNLEFIRKPGHLVFLATL